LRLSVPRRPTARSKSKVMAGYCTGIAIREAAVYKPLWKWFESPRLAPTTDSPRRTGAARRRRVEWAEAGFPVAIIDETGEGEWDDWR